MQYTMKMRPHLTADAKTMWEGQVHVDPEEAGVAARGLGHTLTYTLRAALDDLADAIDKDRGETAEKLPPGAWQYPCKRCGRLLTSTQYSSEACGDCIKAEPAARERSRS